MKTLGFLKTVWIRADLTYVYNKNLFNMFIGSKCTISRKICCCYFVLSSLIYHSCKVNKCIWLACFTDFFIIKFMKFFIRKISQSNVPNV